MDAARTINMTTTQDGYDDPRDANETDRSGYKRARSKTWEHTLNRDQPRPAQTRDMEQTQTLLLLLLLLLRSSLAVPVGDQCMDESFCSYNLQEYYGQMVNLPSHIHERSIASWSYVQNIDLNRVPQVIHEASCHTSHSCRAVEGGFGLETIPVTLRVPVLKKNPACFPSTGFALDFELITVACLCAISRNN